MPILNTWAEILRHLDRSPESGRAREEIVRDYGDLIHRDVRSQRVWAMAEELTARRHALSVHLSDEPPKPQPESLRRDGVSSPPLPSPGRPLAAPDQKPGVCCEPQSQK